MRRIFFATILVSLFFAVPTYAQTDYSSNIGVHAIPASRDMVVGGEVVTLPFYHIGSESFFRLRDIAYVLNGTDARFIVGWDGEINAVFIVGGQPYITRGDELAPLNAYILSDVSESADIFVDGKKADFTAYLIDGSHFVMLEQISTMGFNWYVDQHDAFVIYTEPPVTLNDGEPATIYISWWACEWDDYMLAALAAFMEKYPNIEVVPHIAPYNDWWAHVMLRIAAGDAPDIMLLNYDKMQMIAYDWEYIDLLYDLRELSSILDLSVWPKEWLDVMTFDGILAAVPALSGTDAATGAIPQQGFAIFGYTPYPVLSAYLLNFVFNEFPFL